MDRYSVYRIVERFVEIKKSHVHADMTVHENGFTYEAIEKILFDDNLAILRDAEGCDHILEASHIQAITIDRHFEKEIDRMMAAEGVAEMRAAEGLDV